MDPSASITECPKGVDRVLTDMITTSEDQMRKMVESVKTDANRVASQLKRWRDDIQWQNDNIKKQRTEFAEEKQAFEERKARVLSGRTSAEDIIKINIGGEKLYK